MLNLLTKIKDKAYLIAIISLSTLLTASVVVLKYQDIKMSKLEKSEETFRLINIGLNQTIASLSAELRKKPNEVIVVTREIDAELCKGQSAIDGIMNLPTTQIKAKVVTAQQEKGQLDEKEYVDIDSPFSPEFVRMLQ